SWRNSLKDKRAGSSPALSLVALPVAEATAAERPRMPAGRTIVERTATTIRPAMPARSATTRHRDDRGALGRSLIERRHRHGMRCGHRRKTDADREQGRSKYLHRLSLSVNETNRFKDTLPTLTNDGDAGASDGDDASASDGATGDA